MPSQGAAINELFSRGMLDAYLIAEAMITFFRTEVLTHSNFSMEPIVQAFNTPVTLGSSHPASCTIDRTGDLVRDMFVILDFPAIIGEVEADHVSTFATLSLELAAGTITSYHYDQGMEEILGHYCHWVESVGYVILKVIRLNVGGQQIDHMTSEYLFAYSEACGKAGRKARDSVGHFGTREALIGASASAQRFIVALPFWFHAVAGNALALVSLAFHGVQLTIEFRGLNDLIVVSNPDVKAHKANADGSSTGVVVLASDIQACILTNQIYLDLAERTMFSESTFDQLISVTQVLQYQLTQTSHSVDLNFNNPVVQILMIARLAKNETANDWTNWGKTAPNAAVAGQSDELEGWIPGVMSQFDSVSYAGAVADDGAFRPNTVIDYQPSILTNIRLTLNNQDRVDQPWQFWVFTQAEMHGLAQPENWVYQYSFALYPCDTSQPSGGANFSRIDNAKLHVTVAAEAVAHGTTNLYIFARSWNVIVYDEMVMSIRF